MLKITVKCIGRIANWLEIGKFCDPIEKRLVQLHVRFFWQIHRYLTGRLYFCHVTKVSDHQQGSFSGKEVEWICKESEKHCLRYGTGWRSAYFHSHRWGNGKTLLSQIYFYCDFFRENLLSTRNINTRALHWSLSLACKCSSSLQAIYCYRVKLLSLFDLTNYTLWLFWPRFEFENTDCFLTVLFSVFASP